MCLSWTSVCLFWLSPCTLLLLNILISQRVSSILISPWRLRSSIVCFYTQSLTPGVCRSSSSCSSKHSMHLPTWDPNKAKQSPSENPAAWTTVAQKILKHKASQTGVPWAPPATPPRSNRSGCLNPRLENWGNHTQHHLIQSHSRSSPEPQVESWPRPRPQPHPSPPDPNRLTAQRLQGQSYQMKHKISSSVYTSAKQVNL